VWLLQVFLERIPQKTANFFMFRQCRNNRFVACFIGILIVIVKLKPTLATKKSK